MEAYSLTLLQSCYVCVNLTQIFALTSEGPQCVVHIQESEGSIIDHAYTKKDCRELPYTLMDLPTTGLMDFEGDFPTTDPSMFTTTELTTSTEKIRTDRERCMRCVDKGRHYVKLVTGNSICLLSYDDADPGTIYRKASRPQRCRSIRWDRLFPSTTTTAATTLSIPEAKNQETTTSAPPTVQTSSAGLIICVVLGILAGTLVMGVGAFTLYKKKRCAAYGDARGLIRRSSLTTENILYSGVTYDEVDLRSGQEMTTFRSAGGP